MGITVKYINRMMNFPMRRLSEGGKKWLKAKIKDDCLEVVEMAREVYNECFPYVERNAMKKQLVINTLSFEVYTGVYDGYGGVEQEIYIKEMGTYGEPY